MDDWKSYTPTFTKLNSKSIKLPNGNVTNYYWSRLHIVTTAYEYRQKGKTVNLKVSYKQLSLWETLKFIVRTKLNRRPSSTKIKPGAK